MRVTAVRAALKALVEGIAVDSRARARNTIHILELGQRPASGAVDRMGTIEPTAGPSRSTATYGWDLMDVEYDLSLYYTAGPGVQDRWGQDVERLAARLPTAASGDLYVVEAGDPQATEDDGQIRVSLPVRCVYRTDVAVIDNN